MNPETIPISRRAPWPFFSVPRDHCEKKLDRKNPAWPTSDGGQSLRVPWPAAHPSKGIQIFRQSSLLLRFRDALTFWFLPYEVSHCEQTRFPWIWTGASCSAWILLRAVLSREHNHRSQPFKSSALHTRAFCRLNRAFGNATMMYSVFVCCQRAVNERDCSQWHNGRGGKSKPWIFHVCKGIEGTGRLFIYGKLYVCILEIIVLFFFWMNKHFMGYFRWFEKRNLSNLLISYSMRKPCSIFICICIVRPQYIKVFQLN